MQSSLSPLLLPCPMQDNDENQPDYPFNSFFNDFMPISFQEANLPVLPPENPLDVQFDMCSPTNTNDLSESHSSSFSFVQETCENTDSSSLNTDHSSPEFSFLLNQSQKTISQWNLVSSVPSTNELKIDYLELLKQDKKIEAKKRYFFFWVISFMIR